MICRRLHPFHADIVDVLYGHQFFPDAVQIVYECTVSSRSCEYAAVFLDERSVVGVHGDGVGLFVLIGERDVVLHAIPLFVFVFDLTECFLKQVAVLRGDGDN